MAKEDNSLFEELAFLPAQIHPVSLSLAAHCMQDDVVKTQKAHLPRGLLSALSISCSNVAGAMQSPKGITVN